MKKIGIFGGAFNPIHIGHLISANSILNQLNLDEILFIPCYIPVFKKTHTLADAKFRLQMIKLAISDNKKFRVSSIEIKRKGVSYTIDTLKELSKSNNEYFLIIGADNILDFKKWKEPKEILKLCKLIVTNRGGMDIKIPNSILGHKIYIVQIPNLEISSSTVRRLVREGKSIKYLVPEKVENFILSNKLYREK